jgi:hypothetical protein
LRSDNTGIAVVSQTGTSAVDDATIVVGCRAGYARMSATQVRKKIAGDER